MSEFLLVLQDLLGDYKVLKVLKKVVIFSMFSACFLCCSTKNTKVLLMLLISSKYIADTLCLKKREPLLVGLIPRTISQWC